MESFFEKLKKGMRTEATGEKKEKIEKKEEVKETPKVSKPIISKALKVKARPTEVKVEKVKAEEIETPKIKEEILQKNPEKIEVKKEEWLEPEGELAIDVYQTENYLVIQSAIAGVKPENLDLTLEGDRVTIRGSREKPTTEEGDYFTQECYWGPFSREVILPVEIDPNRAEAEMKEGILIVKIPKIQREKKRKIIIKE